MTVIIYKSLSFKLVGVLYTVMKELGGSYHEKYYQRAIEEILDNSGIPFEREKKNDLMILGKRIGNHYIDFVIDEKVLLEIKKGSYIKLADIKQVLMYLKSANYRLGILAYFGNSGLIIKRVVNSNYQK